MSIQEAVSKSVHEFNTAIDHLKQEFGRLQVGRANASLVENVSIEVYGATQPMKAVASISIPDPKTIQIQPWDKANLAAIEKAIVGIGTGLNPVNDGNFVRINIPPLTEERRTDLVKHVKKLAEDARISVRNSRQDAHNHFKQLKTGSEITEDDLRDADKDLQKKVDNANEEIAELAKSKEQDVMTV
ncbi:ribosome recycling factor [Patescibacteria group bacterium]